MPKKKKKKAFYRWRKKYKKLRHSWKKYFSWSRWKWWMGALVLIIFLTKTFFAFHSFQKELSDIQTLQEIELNDVLQLKTALRQECDSANTLRNYLLLPPKDCVFLDENEGEDSTTETAEDALYFYVTLLKTKQENQSLHEDFKAFVENWNGVNISAESQSPFEISLNTASGGSDEFLELTFAHKDEDLAHITASHLEHRYEVEFGDEKQIFGDMEEVKKFLDSLFQKAQQASEKPQNDSPPSPEQNPPPISATDTSSTQIQVSPPPPSEHGESLANITQNKTFQKYLTALGFTAEEIPDENGGSVRIALKQGGQVVRYISQESETGELLGSLPDGSAPVKLQGLKSLIAENKRLKEEAVDISEFQKIQFGNPVGRENYLLLGHNGGNIDTIILANIDHAKKRVTLISIPRDLLVGENKINALYAKYGMHAFVSQIQSITGQKISYYGLIDFWIFMDGIDALGGISLYLPRAIADPTYKTFDNEEWGTMFFEKGTHHLSGVQALRLARSRATSSDFERARRQHQILSAAHQKAKGLSLRDANTLINIIRGVLKRVETNMSARIAIAQFFKLKDYEIRSGNVMSTSNILVSEQRETAYNGAKQYILIPRDDDWGLIKKYIWGEILKD